MLKNKFFEITNRLSRYPFVAGQSNRIKPELTLPFRRFYMDMRRLQILIGIEVKPV